MVKAIEFENKHGFMLRGFLDLPDKADTIVVFLHGFTGNKTEHAMHFRNFSRVLSKNGIASMRMDYHGNGESDGDFYDFRFDWATEDGLLMIEEAKKIKGIKHVCLLGFSLGGAIASVIARDDLIDKLILWSPAGSMVEHAELWFNNHKKLENGNAYSGGFELSHKFVETIQKYDMFQGTANFTKPVCICHGEKDLSVDISLSKRYNEEYKNCEFHIIPGAGHGYDEANQRDELYKYSLDFVLKK